MRTTDHFFADHPILNSAAIWGSKDNSEQSVYHFRKDFTLEQSLSDLAIYLTASQRYKIWLDGELLDMGPPRQSPDRWPVVTLQIHELSAGSHTFAIEAWHWGANAGKGQLSDEGFFILAAKDESLHELIKTNDTWLCRKDTRRTPCHERAGKQSGHCAVGTGEVFTADNAFVKWNTLPSDESWQAATELYSQMGNEWGNCNLHSWLVASTLPAMRYDATSFIKAHDSNNKFAADDLTNWLNNSAATITIDANSSAQLILDAGLITNAYPELFWHQGQGSTLSLAWAEAPHDKLTKKKLHRDQFENADLPGMKDIIHCGESSGHWASLWFRSFRYLVIDITTGDEAIELKCPRLHRTCYPIDLKTKINVPENNVIDWPVLRTISHRTAELCSHETFFDCPHYEQAQFPGDARVQSRYHYLYANDDRLPKKAIMDHMSSQLPSGLLHSHFPARFRQVISTYSLQWMGMLYDLLRYRGEAEWLEQCMPSARKVLDYFLTHCNAYNGRLPDHLQAPFTDWSDKFTAGNAPQGATGGSAIIALMVAEACQWMTELEKHAGYEEMIPRWEKASAQMVSAVMDLCFDESTGLIADTPEKSSYSVHAQVHGILSGALTASHGSAALNHTLGDESYAQPGTFYYMAHLFEAARKAKAPAVLFQMLPQWIELMQDTGLTTWPERNSTQSRSDCHGWSVVPEIGMIHQVLGLGLIHGETGLDTLQLKPSLAQDASCSQARDLLPINATITLQQGELKIAIAMTDSTLEAQLVSPVGIQVDHLKETLAAGEHTINWQLDK